MNRNKNEIKEEIANKFVLRSMMTYPADITILPLILYFDKEQMSKIPVQKYEDTLIICTACGAFFNPYCPIGESSIYWKCSICGSLNKLPLPPSDSILTPYAIAKRNLCYNNAAFDVIPQQKIVSVQPKIVIAIQSNILNNVVDSVICSLSPNQLYRYSIVAFDSSLQIFNFSHNCWNVFNEDFEFLDDYNYFFDNTGNAIKAITTFHSSLNNGCNINIVCRFVNTFHNTKLVLILSGPIYGPPPSVNFPVSVVFYDHFQTTPPFFSPSFEQFSAWENNPNINILYFNNAFDYKETLNYFLYKALQFPFESDFQIRLRTPKFIENETYDNNIFLLKRKWGGGSILTIFCQFEIKFHDVNGILVYRYVNLKIPYSQDPRIYKTATFPNPLINMSVTATYIMAESRKLKSKPSYVVRNAIMDLLFQYPIIHSCWEGFAYMLITSHLLKDSTEIQQRNCLFLFLKYLPPQLIFLYFLPLQYTNRILIGVFPKTSEEATAIVKMNSIDTISDVGDDIREILMIDEYILPVFKVNELAQYENNEEIFKKWAHDWDISRYGYMKERKKKLLPK